MGEPYGTRLRSGRWWRKILVAFVIFLLLAVAATARYLIWPDLDRPPPRVDAIIELGGPGDRDSAAISLAREGRAAFLVQSTVVKEAGTDKCLPVVRGVSVVCFHADPLTTRGEAQSIARLAQQYRWTSVILVTTPDQAFRAQLRVSRCFPGSIYVVTTPLPPLHWPYWIPYQWGAFAKALLFEREC